VAQRPARYFASFVSVKSAIRDGSARYLDVGTAIEQCIQRGRRG
jgi:hypothetical protein